MQAAPRTSPLLPLRPLAGPALAATLLAAQAPALAQTQQVVRGPVATYWVTADTVAGLGAMAAGGGLGSMLGMLAGRTPGPVRTLDLRLGSTLSPNGAPEAAHLIPPGMAMGPQLPLVTPTPAAPVQPERGERQLPEGMQEPKGRLLVFWGCGDKVGPGQPVILDFSKIGSGQPMPNLVSRAVRAPRGPSFGTSRTYGGWPNERDKQAVPSTGSLRGEHQVKGSYSPDIRFVVEQQDWLAPVELALARSPAGSSPASWKAIAGATGYFMSAFGAGSADGATTDVVMWTSSAVQETGGALVDHVPPGEVARLIRERVVMPPDRTECTVPAEVLKAMPAGIVNFVAYGDELNVSHPPRPQDPKVPWDIQWSVKLRLKSSAMQPLGEGMAGMMNAGGGGRAPASAPAAGSTPPADAGAPPPSSQAPAPGAPTSPTDAVQQGVQEGVRVLRGLFNR